jgi:hypothetical protein
MAFQNNYWSCSKFADWLRGSAKPYAETPKGWREWKDQAKQSNPIRFWLAEEGLDLFQNFLTWPINKLHGLNYYFNNRFITRTHVLRASSSHILRGHWVDLSDRFLPCLFDSLRDYVEVELAWWHIAWSDSTEKKKYNAPFWATGWFRQRLWRCPKAGLDNLLWQMSLIKDESWGVNTDHPEYGQPTPQAINAKEVFDLYTWWTEIYPKRMDPYDASGWSDFCEKRRNNGDDVFDDEKTDEERAESKRILDLCHELESNYDKEDTEMMIRLIKIRHSLWT